MARLAPIVIKRLNDENFHDVDNCDGTFVVDSELVLSVEGAHISYHTVTVEPYKKRYVPEQNRDLRAYIDSPKGAVYLAYIEERVCGQMIISLSWNNYALIEDLEVDVKFRRNGVGQALIEQAKSWASSLGLAGIAVETQNNNVSACRFYERCGFLLCGFDSNLYRGLNPNSTETALFWYFDFSVDDGRFIRL